MKISKFQEKVYDATKKIPIGHVTTYQELAKYIGCNSCQAVGQALKKNPDVINTPCHRVVASNMKIHGYKGHKSGEIVLEKRKLLESEGVKFDGDQVISCYLWKFSLDK